MDAHSDVKCSGCKVMLLHGYGAENQLAHIGPGGCLESN
jgi:hypothetical protein